MDRRSFLRKSIAGAGAVAVTGALPFSEAQAKVKVNTPLEAKGWVSEPARKIAVVDSADVVVVGGGPAGFSAAVSAARQGADVLLLERQYFLGGLFTGCGVTPIINMFSPKGNGAQQAIFGICKELCDYVQGAGYLSKDGIRPKVDPEAAKYFMEEISAKSGVRILYGVDAAQIVMSSDRIDAVILEGKSGRTAIKTKFVVDCTGDGDTLEWAGEDFNVYKDNIGAMWRIGNAENAGRKSNNSTAVKGVYTCHTVGEKNQDGLDMYNLTRIQLKLRKQMWEQAQELREKPGCEDLFLLDTPSVVGVRITRVLNSVCNVLAIDAANGKVYDDVIGYAGADSTLIIGEERYKSGTRPIWQVPYRALVPKKTSNLLVAGRCFGFERPLTYDSREVGTCFMTGQAAGVASALAVESRCSNKEVDIKELQQRLRNANVNI